MTPSHVTAFRPKGSGELNAGDTGLQSDPIGHPALLFKRLVPPPLGGAGYSHPQAIEELLRVAVKDTNLAFVIAQHNGAVAGLRGLLDYPIVETKRRVEELLQSVQHGHTFAIAGSERGISSRKPMAELIHAPDGSLRIHGQKDYVTGTPITRRESISLLTVVSVAVESHPSLIEFWESHGVMPREWRELGKGRINAVALVPASSDGLHWGKGWKSPALGRTETNDIIFDQVAVGAESIIPYAPRGKWVTGNRLGGAVGVSYLLTAFIGGLEQASSAVHDQYQDAFERTHSEEGERVSQRLDGLKRGLLRLAGKLVDGEHGEGRGDQYNSLLATMLATKVTIEGVARDYFQDLKGIIGGALPEALRTLELESTAVLPTLAPLKSVKPGEGPNRHHLASEYLAAYLLNPEHPKATEDLV